MATRTPRPDGLTLAPNAPGDASNPAATLLELQGHRFWGRYDLETQLPNAAANPASAPAFDLLRPGDVAWAQDASLLFVLRSRGTAAGGDAVWDRVPSGADAGSVREWGNDSIANSLTTRYLAPGWDDGVAATVPRQIVMPRPGLFTDIYAHHENPGGTGAIITYTLRVNSVASLLTVGLATTAADASATGFAVAVAAGDVIDLEVTKAAVAGTGSRRVGVTARFL